jgi:predicted acetyltransferase
MVMLRSPCPELKEAFLRMAQEWREQGDDRYRSVLEDFEAYLANMRRFEDQTTVPPDWVRCTEFCLEVDGEIVGCARLRFELNALLELEGGHIGYDVRPSARRRGFGNLILRLVLPEARRGGLERALITADADNYPSWRIIEKNGGVLAVEAISVKSGKLIRRYWIDLTACPAVQ